MFPCFLCYKYQMRYVYPLTLESETRPKRLRRKGLVTLAPLVMMVWFAYWVGIVSQACCQPLLSDAHHANPISHTDGHDAHHDGALATHEPDAPMGHENCPQLKSAELVPASMEPMDSAPKPVLIALLSLSAPLSIFSTPSSHTLYQQSHPPPSRYLRTRRLLI